VDWGAIPLTGPTVRGQALTNPLSEPSTASLLLSTGGFDVSPGQLPRAVGPGALVSLNVQHAPNGPGPAGGDVTVRFQGSSGATRDVTVQLQALVETATLTVLTTALDFGEVLPGTSKDLGAFVRNDSALSSVTVSAVSFPSPAYSVVSPLPLVIAPGAMGGLTVRYAPTGPGTPGGVAQIQDNAQDGPDTFSLGASTGGLQILDLGSLPFSAAFGDGYQSTAPIQFDLPADATAFMVEGIVVSGSCGLRQLVGPGGEVFENTSLTGAYVWSPDRIFTPMIPNNDAPALQIPPGGGTWTLRLLRYSGSDPDVDTRILIQRRPGGTASVATLPLNVFLADGLPVSASGAANDSTLQGVLSGIDAILSQQGISLGDVDYYDIANPAFDDVTTDAEFGQLLALSSAAGEVRLNLFFVNTALGGGVLGVAATIGGPARNGTTLSGVMAKYYSNDVNLSALVAAHEIGHFVGLYHTVESFGQHDTILDTAECQPTGNAAPCTSPLQGGGGYLMHWQAVGGTTVTNGQGLVIRGHPLMDPAVPSSSKPGTALQKPSAPDLGLDGLILPDAWCGTCAACRTVKVGR
jgi:hypothetical protein